MAKSVSEIIGFNVAGEMPLDQVGFVMKYIMERGGKLKDIDAVVETRKIENGHAAISNTNGVAGLLPAPAKPPTKEMAKVMKLAMKSLEKHGPGPVKFTAIAADLKRKSISDYRARTAMTLLASHRQIRSPSFGHYERIDGAPNSDSPVAASVGSQTKEQAILQFITAAGPDGATRPLIMAHLKTSGFTGENWDHGPIIKLIKKKEIHLVGNRGRWAAESSAKSAASGEPTASVSDTRSLILSFLSMKRAPQERKVVVDYIMTEKPMTKASARQTIKRMVTDKQIRESATGIISLAK